MQAELNAQCGQDIESYIRASRRHQMPRSRRQLQIHPTQSLTGDVVLATHGRRSIDARKAEEIRKPWNRTKREAMKRVSRSIDEMAKFEAEHSLVTEYCNRSRPPA